MRSAALVRSPKRRLAAVAIAATLAGCAVASGEPATIDDPSGGSADFMSSAPPAASENRTAVVTGDFGAGEERFHRWSLNRVPMLMRLRLSTYDTFEPHLSVAQDNITAELPFAYADVDLRRVEDEPGVYEANLKFARDSYQSFTAAPMFFDLTSKQVKDGDSEHVSADARYKLEALPVPGWKLLPTLLNRCDESCKEIYELPTEMAESHTVRVSLDEAAYVTHVYAEIGDAELVAVTLEAADGSRTEWPMEKAHPREEVRPGELKGRKGFDVWVGYEIEHVELTFDAPHEASAELFNVELEGLDPSTAGDVDWIDLRHLGADQGH